MEEKQLEKSKIIPFFAIALAIIVTYLPYFKNSFGIDTSTMIMNQRQMLDGYLSQGRFGMVWIFEFFIHHYNNQIVPFAVIPLLIVAGIYIYFIVKKYDEEASSFRVSLFAIAFICNPVVYAQLYFKMQAIQIVVGLFCVLLGTHLSLSETKFSLKLIGTSLLFAFSLLIYQVFAFFIFSMILFSLCFFKKERKEVLQIMMPAWLVGGLVYFISYFLAATVIHYSAYGNETYMMWNKLAELSTLQKVGTLFIGLCGLFYLALLFMTVKRFRAKKQIEISLFVLLLGSILSFNMAFGNLRPAPRVYFGTFSLVFSGTLYLLAKKEIGLKVFSLSIMFLSMIFTFSLSQKANFSYKNDQILTQNIVRFVQNNKISEEKTNLVFIGNLQIGNQGLSRKIQDIFITGATRTSFFQFDPALTSVRPYDFMRIEGYNFRIPNQELRFDITEKYKYLPNYPNQASMLWDKGDETLVVKLSD